MAGEVAPGAPGRQEEDEEFLSTRARRFLLSSSLVRDACLSRLEINYKRDLVSVKRYERFYSKWAVGMYYVLMAINLATILIEQPPTIFIKDRKPPYQIAITINLLCEGYFYYRWYQISEMSEKKKTSDKILTKITFGILLLMSMDAISYIICENIDGCHPLRISRVLRPVLLLTFPESRRLRAAFTNLRKTAVDVLPVLFLMLSTIAVLGIVATNTLTGARLRYPNGLPYFTGFMDVFWELYVLTTTANSPDIIVPAYEHNRIYIVLYVFVSVVCNWLFMSLLVASIYNSYKTHLGESVVRSVAKRKQCLDEAFHLVAMPSRTGEMGINEGTFLRLMRVAKPGRSEDALRVIFHILNRTRSGYLSIAEFSRLAEYVRVKMVEIELSRVQFEKYVPKFYLIYITPQFQKFKNIMQHRTTSWFFMSLLVANAVTAVLLRNYPTVQDAVEWFFTLIFLLELLLRYLASGGVNFFSDRWNLFDCVVVVGAFFGQLLQGGLVAMGIALTHGVTQMLLLLRMARMLKLLSGVQKFRVIINCIVAIFPSLFAYSACLFVLYYMYACISMEIFNERYEEPKGLDYKKDNSCNSYALLNSDFAKLHYCSFNFNSIVQSFIFLFVLTIGNNWHLLTEGLSLTTTRWARALFVVVHWTCVLLVLNVVLAFIIEAFLIEYDAHSTRFEQYVRDRLAELGVDANVELEKRGITNYGKPGFYLTHKQLEIAFPPDSFPSKVFMLKEDTASIEILMFRMFEQEVEQLLDNYRNSRRISLFKSRDPHADLHG